MRDKDEEYHQHGQGRGGGGGGGGGQQERQPIPADSTASPPSASASPTHEFSFTISFCQPSTDKAKAAPPPTIAVDLSPADDIFFHGHLLPLHLLSHLPISPRSSANSLDSFTLPITELLQDQNPNKSTTRDNNINGEVLRPLDINLGAAATDGLTNERHKSKSSSFFALPRWRRGFEVRDQKEEKEKHKRRKMRLDVSHVIKRYMRMVRPLLSFRWRREDIQLPRQAYSFSGTSTPRGKQEYWRKRREFSAPASLRTSPTNSGHLVVAAGIVPTNTNDSTMEELQAAIQAAIAHCKNSISVEDKIKG